MIIVTDLAGTSEPLYDVKPVKRKRKVNGEKSITLQVFNTDRNKYAFPLIQEESTIEHQGINYIVKKCEETSIGNRSVKQVTALHEMFKLIDHYVYDTLPSGAKQLDVVLDFILNGSGFTYVVIGNFPSVTFENFGNDNAIALIQKVLERYKVEFSINGTHFTFTDKIGAVTDFQFRYKHNLKTLKKHVDTSNLSTYIRGYGKDGLMVEYTSPNAEKFGIRHAKPVTDDRYTTESGLLERIMQDIVDTPELSYTLDFITLRSAGYPYEIAGEGDEVLTIYEPMDVDINARIMEIDEEFDQDDNLLKCNVTVANFRNNVADFIADLGNTQKQVEKILTEEGKVRYSVLDEAVKRVTEVILSSETELEYTNVGIIARSKINPNHIVIVSSNGIGVSVDNGQTIKTAMTAEGIVTELLTAGIIQTDRIKIVGENDLFVWDGNGLTANSPTDVNKYLKMSSNGLEARKGMVYVEREDGLATIIGGRLNVDFAIQGSNPPFMVDSTLSGRYFKTSKSASEGGAYCDIYTFKRVARYLKLELALARERETTATAYASVIQAGGTETLATVSSTDDVSFETIRTMTVDLGVPDGNTFAIYLKLMTNNGTMPAYCRVNRIYQTDL